MGGGGQMRRVGPGRWTPAAEKRFFEELAASANVKRAAAAAGVSPNAVYARRLKQPLFRSKWAAVLDSGRAAIEMNLIGAANRSFDPDEIDTGDVEPRVSAAEAIRIVQLHGGGKARREGEWQTIEEQAAAATPDDIEQLRAKLIRKLERMELRERPKRLAEGWARDDEHETMVPPGWIRRED